MIALKKTVLAILTLGVATLSNAAMYQPPVAHETQAPTEKQGFYVGLGLGVIQVSDDYDLTVSSTLVTSNPKDTGLNSTFFTGYAWTFPNKIFLAGELFGNLLNTGSSLNVNDPHFNGYFDLLVGNFVVTIQ